MLIKNQLTPEQFKAVELWGKEHGRKVLLVNQAQGEATTQQTQKDLEASNAFDLGLAQIAKTFGFDKDEWDHAVAMYQAVMRSTIRDEDPNNKLNRLSSSLFENSLYVDDSKLTELKELRKAV